MAVCWSDRICAKHCKLLQNRKWHESRNWMYSYNFIVLVGQSLRKKSSWWQRIFPSKQMIIIFIVKFHISSPIQWSRLHPYFKLHYIHLCLFTWAARRKSFFPLLIMFPTVMEDLRKTSIIHEEKTRENLYHNCHKIRWTFAFNFFKNYSCFEKLYQIFERVFHLMPKHFKVS